MTTLTRRFTEAIDHARIAHASQYRKGTRTPYLYHLLGVSSLVLEFGGDEDQAIAGLLHDVIEDCGEAHRAIVRDTWGDVVADIVEACTDGSAEKKTGPKTPEQKLRDWWERKLAYLAHLEDTPASALLVSACDKLHNARAIVGDLENPEVGLDVFRRFTAGQDGTLRYYHSLSVLFRRMAVRPARELDATVARMHVLAGAEQRLPLEHGIYWLKVYDNFHYMDADKAHVVGPFLGADEAMSAARQVVEDSIRNAPEGDVLDHYRRFGEDPQILGSPSLEFSAWTYAAECVQHMASYRPSARDD